MNDCKKKNGMGIKSKTIDKNENQIGFPNIRLLFLII
jgi:hypothetical protein